MRRRGISALQRRGYVTTTTEAGDAPLAPNLLARRFAPGQLAAWVADLTAIRTDEGWLYLAVVIDLQTRMVLGWSMDEQPRGQLALDALLMALGRRQPQAGQLHHSDRGGNYSSRAYQALLAKHELVASMSRRGNCYDNAAMESFWSSLKRELVHRRKFATHQEARAAIFEWIEIFYNRERLHSALGYQSPVDFETQLN